MAQTVREHKATGQFSLQGSRSGSPLHLHDKGEMHDIVAVTTQRRHMALSENPQGVRKGGSSRWVFRARWGEWEKSFGPFVLSSILMHSANVLVCANIPTLPPATTTSSTDLSWQTGIYDRGCCTLKIRKNKRMEKQGDKWVICVGGKVAHTSFV